MWTVIARGGWKTRIEYGSGGRASGGMGWWGERSRGGYPVTDSGMHRGVVDQPSYPSTRWLGHSLKGTGDVDSTESACG